MASDLEGPSSNSGSAAETRWVKNYCSFQWLQMYDLDDDCMIVVYILCLSVNLKISKLFLKRAFWVTCV